MRMETFRFLLIKVVLSEFHELVSFVAISFFEVVLECFVRFS
jgi:hypothetical protein